MTAEGVSSLSPVSSEDVALWSMVAEWFAAIGTVGALLLGVAILNADRNRALRASADGLVTWTQIHHTHAVKNKAPFTVYVHAYNAGDRPIPFSMTVPRPGSSLGFPGVALSLEPIAPGQSVVSEIGLEENPEDMTLWLWFRDDSSKSWIRDLKTNEYVSKRTLQKLYEKYKDDPLKSLHMLFPRRPFIRPSMTTATAAGEQSQERRKRRRHATE